MILRRPIISEVDHQTGSAEAKLRILHRTTYSYAVPPRRILLKLRLWPSAYAALRLIDWQVTVNGTPIHADARNGYGELVALYGVDRPGNTLDIIARGIIHVRNSVGVVSDLPTRPNPLIFLRETPLTAADDAIRALGSAAGEPDALAGNRIGWLHQLMAIVRDRIMYQPGQTNSATTAIEAMAMGCGVCQDHAHVFVAAARAHGVPARYVVGYLLASEGADEEHQTHAWAEAWVDELGWVGFDPSIGVSPTERYVRLCAGLDSFDAAPIRGHVTGGDISSVDADVRIGFVEGAATNIDSGQEQRLMQDQQTQQ